MRVIGWFALALILATTGCGGSRTRPLIGGGSTFVNPLMQRWVAEFAKTDEGFPVEYNSIGSAAGILRTVDQSLDFGCTDGPLSDEQLEEARKKNGAVVHVPLVLGGVVPTYNVPEVKPALRFTGEVLADIYLGVIKTWDDPRLVALNPGAGLPAKPINVVHRQDGSGTTYVWMDYLAKASASWKKKFPEPKLSITWPVGVGKETNDGVAEHVKATPYAIGYVELTHAYKKNLAHGLVRNPAGEFVQGSLESFSDTADDALKDANFLPADLRFSLTNAPGEKSYPITSAVWAIADVKQPSAKRNQIVSFLRWSLGEGQDYAPELLYARLPEAMKEKALAQVQRIEDGK
jgi:phosphate ABC transporter phosphate-binding protein